MEQLTRRTLIGAGLGGIIVGPWSRSQGAEDAGPGLTDTEITLGMSAAFSGPSRGLGIELYRGAMAYFTHVNRMGGVGRTQDRRQDL